VARPACAANPPLHPADQAAQRVSKPKIGATAFIIGKNVPCLVANIQVLGMNDAGACDISSPTVRIGALAEREGFEPSRGLRP
jgi:hypothetical protein